MGTTISIMLFDDNKRIRDSLSLLFSGHPLFNWKGAHMDATHVMEVMDAGTPDVVLMDIDMPGVNGIQAVRFIKKKYPDQVIMMLTTFEDDDKVFDAICAGASGYIVKSKSLTHLIDAVKEVYNGGAPMSPSIARKVLQLFKEKNAPGDADSFHLTDREKEVLVHLINGSSYKMIAGAMQLSYDTVHSHIKNIYKKLQVNSVSEAVSKAMRLRL